MPDANDMRHKAARLRGLALQLERGDFDRDFAEADAPIAERRALIVRRIRDLAAQIDQ